MNPLTELVGESSKMIALRQQAHALIVRHEGARRLPPVLIHGETGTGKGLLARLLHRAGPRARAPFVDVNCAAIPETLLEAELFGYEQGAFTDARHAKRGLFQTAHGGTLFLDEIGLLPRGLQAKLLTVLEERRVRRLGATTSELTDVAIIAATNEPLRSAVAEGRFREDLYHRLAVLTLEVPPLRERRGDIDLLADRLLARTCADYDVPVRVLGDEARRALRAYGWPGNVRELGNVIERAVLMSDASTITTRGLGLPRDLTGQAAGATRTPETEASNRERLLEALEKTGGNISRTAALLGLTRNTVRARMRVYSLRPLARPGGPAAAPEPSPEPSAAPAPTAPGPTAPAPGGIRWERRRITVVRARAVAPDQAQPPSLIARALGALIEKTHSFGGQVNEVTPDAVVAIFGHEPVEDSPRRGATAALAMLKAFEREHRSGALPAEVSLAIAVHVQSATLAHVGGRAVLEPEATGGVGAALDALEPIAAGEIAVSEGALGFLARAFEVAPRPDARAGGHRLLGRVDIPGGVHQTEFVGRQPELGLLHGLLDRAVQGHGQIVSLVGEPGIGKSRLLRELVRSARSQGVVALEGHCASYGVHVPYFPVIEILQRVCDIEDSDPIETIDAKVLTALRPLGDAAVPSAPYLQYLLFPRTGGELRDRSPDAIKTRTFEAIRRLVLAQQERRPLLLAIEDLQWIDQTSSELLAFLVRAIEPSRVLVVLTCRQGYRADWLTSSNATQLAIGPLTDAESRQLVLSGLGVQPTADALLARIVGRGEGNPLFLEELTRTLREHPDEAASPAVPGTLHDVIAARIDGLEAADREVLEVAAVIGPQSAVDLLQQASGRSDAELRATLGRLQSGEFLYAMRFGAEAEYTFRHAITHEVAYANVPEAARAPLHGRVLAALLALTPEMRERRPETLARHASEANRQVEAIDYWHRAGQLAMQRSAHGDAIAHLREALRLLTLQPDADRRVAQEVALQLALATSLTAARGYAAPEVGTTLARIRVLADRLDDAAKAFAIRWPLWRFEISRADFRAAEQLAGQMLDLADPGDPAAQVAAHVAAGVDKFYLGEFARALEHLRQALAAYDSARAPAQVLRYGQDLGVAAGGFLGWAEALVGELTAAAGHAEEVLRLARGLRHPFSLALALFLACEIYQEREEPAAVQPLAGELLALAREHSYTFFSAFGLMHGGWARARTGDGPGGLAMMHEGAELFRKIGQRVGLAHRARLAEILLASGDLEAALAVIADALEQRRQTEEHAFVAAHLRLRGEALRQRGDHEGARLAVQEALDIARAQGAWLLALRAACSLARLEPSALELVEALVRRFPSTIDSTDLRAARALLGRAR